MKATPISRPLPGERVLGVHPPLDPHVPDDWPRRLRLYQGRSLSAEALELEQRGRAGRLALLNQALSPGVVSGLEAAVETAVEASGQARHFIHVAPGFGLTANGEDIYLPRALRVDVLDLKVFAPVRFLQAGRPPATPPGSPEPQPGTPSLPPGERPPGTPSSSPNGPGERAPGGTRAVLGEVGVVPLEARKLGGPLRELLSPENNLPSAGILLLQPVTVEAVGKLDPDDPCEQDPDRYAFEDWQRIDGCRLIFYAWPGELFSLPALTGPDAQRARNLMAYDIFSAEARLRPHELLPWEEIGLPVGLVVFDVLAEGGPRWSPRFLDRFSVVRSGGKPKRRTPLQLPSAAGSAFLWQARLQQFAEQVAHFTETDRPLTELSGDFRFVPPIGLLPKGSIEPRAGRQHFFPPAYQMEAVPVPLEQLDLAFRESAALAPYDLFDVSTTESVRIMAPVPQIWYEPKLLQVEAISSDFQETIDRFVNRRGKWLLRREQVRTRARALQDAITGAPSDFPTPDPDALETETTADNPLDPEDSNLTDSEEEFGVEFRDQENVVTEYDALIAKLRASTPIRGESWAPLEGINNAAPVLPASLPPSLRYDVSRKMLIFNGGVMSAADRDSFAGLANATDDFKSAIATLFERSQNDELTQLDQLGLERFIEFIEEKIQKANDKIDLGFLRTQTDIYRARQFMVGNVAAARLATSPALASIAKGESAAATREELSEFLKELKKKVPVTERSSEDSTLGGTSGGTRGPAAAAPPPPPPVPGTRAAPKGSTSFAAGEFTVASGSFLARPVVTASRPESSTIAFTPQEAVFLQPAAPAAIAPARAEVGVIAQATRSEPMLFATTFAPTKGAVTEKAPVVGKVLDFRNITVGERIEQPASPEAKDFSVANKYEILKSILEIDLWMDDLDLPGFVELNADQSPKFLEGGRVLQEKRFSVAALRKGAFLQQVLLARHDPDPVDGDEGAFFSRGVRAVDHSVAALRLIEGRVQAYRSALRICQEALEKIQSTLDRANVRLGTIAEMLAEARHDVSVSRALLAEEESRIQEINLRRDKIVAEHVPFFAYCRPRVSDHLRTVPHRTLNPGLLESPIPACLSEGLEAPPELRSLVDLLREGPLAWFIRLPKLLDRLDRLETLQEAFFSARDRAVSKFRAAAPPAATRAGAGKAALAVQKVFTAHQQVITQYRARTAQFDLSFLAAQSWKVSRDQAREILSLGDIIDGKHGHTELVRQAAAELENIYRVAACLYVAFGQVLPSIRLDWVERLSQFDEPVSLRNLASLPRWNEIEFVDRVDLQSRVDWLYQRIDLNQPDAVAILHDLVRSCLLLASHAPVDEIISGHLPRETTVAPGAHIEVKPADIAKVRIGMDVLMYAGARVVAQARVEDLSGGQVSARVIKAEASSVVLQSNARVQFTQPGRVMAATARHR